MTSLHSCVPTALATLAGDLHGGSLVLLDAGSAECIASAAGIKILYDMGVVSVGNLSSSSLHRDVAAAAALAGGRLSSLTIFISTMLAPAEARILAACRAAMKYTSHIVLACAVSEIGHYDEVPSMYSPTCYSDFCTAVRHQLQPKERFEISAKLCPLLTIPLSDSAFVLPVGGAAAGAVTSSGRSLGYVAAVQTAAESDDEEDEINEKEERSKVGHGSGKQSRRDGEKAHGVTVLAHALASIASSLGVRPEAFCLGPASIAVGKSLTFVASEDAPPAAFVLVDRAADLGTPLMHADILMQKAWERLRYGLNQNQGESGDEGKFTSGSGDVADRNNISNRIGGWEDDEMLELGGGGGGHFVPGIFTPTHVPVPMPNEISFSSFLPGSVFHPDDSATTSHFGFLLTRPGKDAAMFVRKWLREAARKEGIPAASLRSKPGAGGVITAQELRSLAAVLASFSPECEKRNIPLLQLAEAAALALDDTTKNNTNSTITTDNISSSSSSAASMWDALRREEQLLELACSEGAEPVCDQLVDLFASAGRGGPVRLPDAVGLLLLAYQVLPDHLPWYAGGGGGGGGRSGGATVSAFTAEHEARLRASIADAVVACSSRWVECADPEKEARKDASWLAPPLFQRLINSASNDNEEDAGERRALHLELRDAVGDMLRRLQELSSIKQKAQQGIRQSKSGAGGGSGGASGWDEGFDFNEGGSESSSSSLLVRLASAIADRREIKGLKHSSTSLAGLLKSGLGRFGLQKQPQPGDYPLVVLFVLGGVSVSEIHQVLACVDAKTVAAAAAHAGSDRREAGFGQGAGTGSANPPPKMIVGGTALLQPRDIVIHALARN